MKKALRLAEKGAGRTSPNPMVGAVIVRNGVVISSGYHKKAGQNHAEVDALIGLNGKAEPDDILYVTLEPCNHYGKTPPCTHAILEKGIRHVVVGMDDPNPDVAGGGIKFLSKNGVHVRTNVLENECKKLNESFTKWIKTGRPFVIAKSALTLDGWTATHTGHSKWITNEKSRRFVHRLRDRVDGILVGAGTILADDPSLTTRLRNQKSRDAVRIIVDTYFKIPYHAKVLNPDSYSMTYIVIGRDVPIESVKAREKTNVSFLSCPTKEGEIDLTALMDILGKRYITSIMVEGGSGIMGSMMRARLIDKFYIFKAPMILGGGDGVPMAGGCGPKKMDQALRLKDVIIRRFIDDTLIIGYPKCSQG